MARDEAFCFYYQENLDLLESLGWELIPFSPLKDHHLPCSGLTAILLGGGYPELYAKELSELIPLFDLWLTPSIYPATAEEIRHKFVFIKELLDKMGLPLIDDEIMENVEKTLSNMGEIKSE